MTTFIRLKMVKKNGRMVQITFIVFARLRNGNNYLTEFIFEIISTRKDVTFLLSQPLWAIHFLNDLPQTHQIDIAHLYIQIYN